MSHSHIPARGETQQGKPGRQHPRRETPSFQAADPDTERSELPQALYPSMFLALNNKKERALGVKKAVWVHVV